MEAQGIAIELPPEAIEAIAERVAAKLAARHTEARWLYGAKEAARYLGWPVKRIYERSASGALPSHKDGGSLVFNTAELDAHLRGQ